MPLMRESAEILSEQALNPDRRTKQRRVKAMDKRGTIPEFIAKRQNAISLILKQTRIVKKEDIHALRVEIKKLKAAYLLLDHISPQYKLRKSFHAISPLFKQAGRIREIQLHRIHLSTYGLYPELPQYKKLLDKKQEKEFSKFHKVQKQFTPDELEHLLNKSKMVLDNTKTKPVQSYLLQSQKHICQLLEKKQLKTSEVHDLRKTVKSFFYLSGHFTLQNKKLKGLNPFQELLGKWHDCEVFADDISKVVKKENLPANELKKLNLLKTKVDKEREVLFLRINQERKKIIVR